MARMSIRRIPEKSARLLLHRLVISAAFLIFFITTIGAGSETSWIKNDLKSRLPAIYVDYWAGKADVGEPYVCLFVELSPSDMTFTPSGGRYVANYEIDISIWDQQSQRIKTKILRDSVYIDNYDEVNAYNWNRLYRAAFELDDGRYQAMIEIIDKQNNKSALLQQELVVNSEEVDGIDASDILVARRDAYGSGSADEMVGILPYPGKVYGAEQPEIFYYFEIYSATPTVKDSATYKVYSISPENEQVLLNSGRVSVLSGKVPVLHSLRVAEHAPGRYDLIVEVTTPGGVYQIERREVFSVHQNPLDLRFKPFSRVLKELELVAAKEEMEKLKNTAESEQQGALYRFWADRDPTPGTEKNELYLEFYERLFIAQRLYTSGEGDITDQGKVFMMLGAPDEVVKYEDRNVAFADTQVWKYDSQHLKVVFRDEIGSGNYRLISPYSLLDN